MKAIAWLLLLRRALGGTEEGLPQLGQQQGNVVSLDDQTFQEQTRAGTWFVKFYAPWCGHCKAMASEWEELANKAKDSEAGYKVAEVDITANAAVKKRFSEVVKGFPTLILFADDKMYNYNGARTAEEASKFATEGYKSEDGTAVPPPPPGKPWLVQLLQRLGQDGLAHDVESILNFHKNAAALLVALGALLGLGGSYLLLLAKAHMNSQPCTKGTACSGTTAKSAKTGGVGQAGKQSGAKVSTSNSAKRGLDQPKESADGGNKKKMKKI